MTMLYGIYRPLLCLALALFVIAGTVEADPDLLKVAIPAEGYPPYIITRETPGVGVLDDAPTGIVIEALKQAAAREHISLTFVHVPELRGQMMLDEGLVDARMESPHWVNHPEQYLWSEPITRINDVFVFSMAIPNTFETDQDMQGAEIVTHLGYTYPTLEPLFESGQITRDDRQTEEFMLTAIYQDKNMGFAPSKRAVVMDELVARWFINRHPRYRGQFQFSTRLVASAPLHFQFVKRPDVAALVARLNSQIAQLKDSGQLRKIIGQMIELSQDPERS